MMEEVARLLRCRNRILFLTPPAFEIIKSRHHASIFPFPAPKVRSGQVWSREETKFRLDPREPSPVSAP